MCERLPCWLLWSVITFGVLACGDDDAQREPSADGSPDTSIDTLDADVSELDASDRIEDANEQAEDGGTSSDAVVPVTVRFKGKVGAHDYACDRIYSDQGTSGARASGRAFRFFVSDVRLLSMDGSDVPLELDERAPAQSPDVALLDFQNPNDVCGTGAATNTTITGHAPAGDYRGLKFVVGVPEALNHGDPALLPEPLRGSGLSWGWLQGYRFLVTELALDTSDAGVLVDAAAELSDAQADAAMGEAGIGNMSSAGGEHMGGGSGAHAFEPGLGRLHIGSTGCLGSPQTTISCSKPNRAHVQLADFDPRVSTVIADIGALFTGVDLARGLQCHARGDGCAPFFQALGVDLATGAPLSMQSVFRVE